jgi:hypothetical protein
MTLALLEHHDGDTQDDDPFTDDASQSRVRNRSLKATLGRRGGAALVSAPNERRITTEKTRPSSSRPLTREPRFPLERSRSPRWKSLVGGSDKTGDQLGAACGLGGEADLIELSVKDGDVYDIGRL